LHLVGLLYIIYASIIIIIIIIIIIAKKFGSIVTVTLYILEQGQC